MQSSIYPIFTTYPEVHSTLQAVLGGAREVLGGQFAGMYVHGSLALGGFEPGRSDIDFLVATSTRLTDGLTQALREMHARLAAARLPWAGTIEGSYIPLAALRRYDPLDCAHPALRSDGSFEVDGHGPDWIIQRHILREKGLRLAGPPARELIDPVEPEELRRAQLGILRSWWSRPFASPERFGSAEYQAYAVLTMCRALYMLEFGEVAPKPQAAAWAQRALGLPWAGLIEWALAWRRGGQEQRLDEALDFIDFTLERWERAGVNG